MPRCADCLHYNFVVGFCPDAEGRRTEKACEKFQGRTRKNPHEEFVNQLLHYNQARWYFEKREEEKKQIEAPKNQGVTSEATVSPKKRKPVEQRGRATGNQLPAKRLNRQAPPQNRLPQSPDPESNQKPWKTCEGPLSPFFTEKQGEKIENRPEPSSSRSVFQILSGTKE